MKVHELISYLQKLNPESEIYQENDEYDFVRYFSVTEYPYSVDIAKCSHNSFINCKENKNTEIVVFPEKITIHNSFNK
jgi:hypothetical protein